MSDHKHTLIELGYTICMFCAQDNPCVQLLRSMLDVAMSHMLQYINIPPTSQ